MKREGDEPDTRARGATRGGLLRGLLAVLLPLAATTCADPPPEGPPHVVFWLVDTLRADHLGCYGYERDTSPVMDALAEDGVLFLDAHAHSNWTQPSVASLLSGCYPPTFDEHFTSTIPQGLMLGAEWMREHGYATAGFTVTAATAAIFGFHRGFRVYDELDAKEDLKSRKHREGPVYDAERVVDAAADWLDHRWPQEQPFFLFLHTVDPHPPYDTHPELPTFTVPYDGPHDGDTVTIAAAVRSRTPFTPADRKHIVDLYDDEIRYNDRQLGRFLDELDARGLRDDTLVVVVSDHGEEFWDRGSIGHGHKVLHRFMTHVPLIMSWPRGLPEGVEIDGLLGLVDVMPTVLDLVDLPPLPEADGVSIRPVIEAAGALTDRRNVLFVDRAKLADDVIALRTADALYIDYGEAEFQRLFDLEADPDARRDLMETQPRLAAELAGHLERWRELRDAREGVWREQRDVLELGDDVQAALRELGYLGDDGEPGDG